MRLRMGCDIGGTNVKLGLLDGAGNVVKDLVLPSPARAEPPEMVACLKRGIEDLAQGRNIIGLGVGIAGVIDFEKGIVHTSPNLSRWKEVPFQRMLEKALGLKTRVDNDANVFLLGELMAGAAKGAGQAVGLTLGTGVGGAIVINGRLYRGTQGGAGEIGHTTVQADGPKCRCGNRGCLERYVGAKYLVERYQELSVERSTLKIQWFNINPAVITQRAKKGDKAAIRVFKEAGEWIGVACANLVNLLQPEVIVIGGGVAGAGKVLFDSLRQTVKERAFEVSWRAVRIVPGRLKEKAGIVGAAALI